MVEQIINSLKQVLALNAFLLLVAPSFSQECLSLGNGNWGNTANWNCGGVNRLPTCGDIVKIQAGHTVTVANQYNLLGCGSSMIVDVTGTLQFTTGNKLQLPCGSILSIQTDIDGTVKTLGVVELDNSSKADLDMISLFPNSTSNSISFKGLPGQFRGEFSLYSLNGLRVFYSSVSEE